MTGKKVPVICLAGCAVVVLAITTGKKKFQSSVWRVGSGDYDRKKKSSSRLSGGLSVFGSGDYDRKKKVPVVCLAGCAVVSVFGSGNYDRKKKVQVVIKFVLAQLELKLIQVH